MVQKKLQNKKYKNLKIFILGNKGFLGSFLEKDLRQYFDVYGINRKNYNKFVNKECDVFINANGNSKKYLAENEPLKDFDLTCVSTYNTLNNFSFKKYVYISSIDVYPNLKDFKKNKENAEYNFTNNSNYGLNKIICENLIKKSVDNWIILRLSGMVGPNLSKGPIYDIKNNLPLRLSPNSEMSFMSLKQVSEILMVMILKKIKNEVFNIASPKNIKLSSVMKLYNYKNKVKRNLIKIIIKVNTDKLQKIFTVKDSRRSLKEFMESE